MIQSLGYAAFSSPTHEEWLDWGPRYLGLEVADTRGTDGAVRLRVDDAAWRLAIHPGERDDLLYIGWTVESPQALAALEQRLRTVGVEVTRETHLAAERGVVELISFEDPFGLRNEAAWGLTTHPGTFRPGRPMSGFVTGDGGLGHIVLITPSLELSEAFYCDLLGFALTDEIQPVGGPRIHFYHCNSRHHSLAMAEVPGITGVQHLMLETRSLDDVGTALDLLKADGHTIQMDMGTHTNDHMTSFYVRTPAAFDIEYGWGGLLVDHEHSRPHRYEAVSIWGHKNESGQLPPPAIIHPVGVLEEVLA